MLEACHRVRQTGSTHINNLRKEKQQKWIPPPKSVFKINVDIATNNQYKKVGLSAVITNSEGKIVVASINQSYLQENVSIAEAEAIELGLQVAKNVALSYVIIGSYCKNMVELVKNTKGSRIAIHWIISNIQHLTRDFQYVNFVFVLKDCNAHAHSLAKFALENDTSAVWKESFPAEYKLYWTVLFLIE